MATPSPRSLRGRGFPRVAWYAVVFVCLFSVAVVGFAMYSSGEGKSGWESTKDAGRLIGSGTLVLVNAIAVAFAGYWALRTFFECMREASGIFFTLLGVILLAFLAGVLGILLNATTDLYRNAAAESSLPAAQIIDRGTNTVVETLSNHASWIGSWWTKSTEDQIMEIALSIKNGVDTDANRARLMDLVWDLPQTKWPELLTRGVPDIDKIVERLKT